MMNLEQTQAFAYEWNTRNGYESGEDTADPNMRVMAPGVVFWNDYASPDVSIEEFVSIHMWVTNNEL